MGQTLCDSGIHRCIASQAAFDRDISNESSNQGLLKRVGTLCALSYPPDFSSDKNDISDEGLYCIKNSLKYAYDTNGKNQPCADDSDTSTCPYHYSFGEKQGSTGINHIQKKYSNLNNNSTLIDRRKNYYEGIDKGKWYYNETTKNIRYPIDKESTDSSEITNFLKELQSAQEKFQEYIKAKNDKDSNSATVKNNIKKTLTEFNVAMNLLRQKYDNTLAYRDDTSEKALLVGKEELKKLQDVFTDLCSKETGCNQFQLTGDKCARFGSKLCKEALTHIPLQKKDWNENVSISSKLPDMTQANVKNSLTNYGVRDELIKPYTEALVNMDAIKRNNTLTRIRQGMCPARYHGSNCRDRLGAKGVCLSPDDKDSNIDVANFFSNDVVGEGEGSGVGVTPNSLHCYDKNLFNDAQNSLFNELGPMSTGIDTGNSTPTGLNIVDYDQKLTRSLQNINLSPEKSCD